MIVSESFRVWEVHVAVRSAGRSTMVELVALPSGSGSDVVAMAIAEEIVLKKCGAHEGVEVHAVATFSKFVNDVEVVRDHPLIDRLIDRKERP